MLMCYYRKLKTNFKDGYSAGLDLFKVIKAAFQGRISLTFFVSVTLNRFLERRFSVHVRSCAERVLRIIESLNLRSIVCVFDQAICCKSYEIKWKQPVKFKK